MSQRHTGLRDMKVVEAAMLVVGEEFMRLLLFLDNESSVKVLLCFYEGIVNGFSLTLILFLGCGVGCLDRVFLCNTGWP